VGAERRRDRDARGVRTTAPERRMLPFVDALEPAITAISPAASASLIGWLSIETMRARANELSVTILHWWPRNDRALPPAARIASATSPTETCSPVDTMTSTSRSFGSSWSSPTSLSRRLVSPDIAETTTATW
jgi:hypothetical protein